MKIGVCGSRAYPNRPQVEWFVRNLIPKDWTIVSGACLNSPDEWAVKIAKSLGMAYIEYPAKWKNPDGSINKRAGFERNSIIVDESDVLVAFWNGKSNGTMDTYQKAVKAGKPVWLIHPEDDYSL